MDERSPEELELERLQTAYREAIDEVMSLGLDEVLRFARLLEVEAKFLGRLEAAREAVDLRQKGGQRTH